MVIGAQFSDDDITHHAGVSGCLGQGAFLGHGKHSIILDPSHERRAGIDDITEELIVGVAAIDDIEPARLQHGAELFGLGTGCWSESGIDGSVFENLEMQMELSSAVS